MPKALVTGATGFVGSNLCNELLQNGYEVTGLYRDARKVEPLKSLNVNWVKGDVTNIDSIRAAAEGAEYVFHIAALFREAKFPDSVYTDVNVKGSENVLTVASEVGVKKIVHCSTVGVHSHIDDCPADESEPFRPGDVYQESKCEGERLVNAWLSEGKIRGSIIRPAMIWGAGDERTLKIFKGIYTRRLPLIGDGETRYHWVNVTDLARAFRQAAETDRADGETYIIAGERSVTIRELFESIARIYKVKLLPLKIPAAPVQMLGSLTEAVCKPFGIEPPLYRRRVDFFTKSRCFSWQKAGEQLGYMPQMTFEDEVREISTWYLDNGWL